MYRPVAWQIIPPTRCRIFLEAGIPATINTDDPGISGITLPYEYNIAAPKAGLTDLQISQAQQNALEVAFLNAAEKQALRESKSPLLTIGPDGQQNPTAFMPLPVFSDMPK